MRCPQVGNKKFYAYGYGDGGGGPFAEMIEEARFSSGVDGMPNIYHTTASDFMKMLEKDIDKYPTHTGELYLELHRGTLTQMHEVKRGNRKTELAMRDTEYFNVLSGLKKDPDADKKLKTLLKNQFHDILPGSSINEVNVQAIAEFKELISQYKELTAKYSEKLVNKAEKEVTVFYNTGNLDIRTF